MALIISKKIITEPHRVSSPIPDDAEAVWDYGRGLATGEDWAKPEGELAVDVYVTASAVVVRSAMAGVKPEDINISLHNDLLTIRGERLEEEMVEADHFIARECHWGSFSRSIILPVSVEARGAQAIMKSGVLKIILPRVNPSLLSVRVDDSSYE